MSKEDRKSGKRLKELKEDIDVPLAAILTLNTISHTIGAAGVGSEFNKLGNEWFTVASIILTILILVFSEIIPKTLGAIYWKKWAPSSAYLLDAMIWITWPIVVVLNSFSRKISEGNEDQKEMTREEMIAVAEMGENQGALEKQETQVIKNLLTMDKILAEDVMTPSTVMLTFQRNDKVGKIVLEKFEKEEFDVCHIFYNQFKNVMTQIPQKQQIIPLQKEENADTLEKDNLNYEFEPDEDEILNNLLPKNISTQIFKAMLENSASEQGSRMTAMDNATRNAGELVDKLSIEYNRSRQAAITKELIEIISGAESL